MNEVTTTSNYEDIIISGLIVGMNKAVNTNTDSVSLTVNNQSSPSGGRTSLPTPAITVTTEKSGGSIINKTELSPTTSSGTASASISEAIISELLNNADLTGGTGSKDVLEVSVDTPNNMEKLIVSIPQNEIEKIVSNTDSNFAITSPITSITFDSKALETISEANSSGTVVISAGIIDSNALSDADKEKVGGRPDL